MTILERINLHKCGYTKEEIAALAEEEKQNPVVDPVEPEPAEPTEPAADPTHVPAAEPTTNNAEILKAIKDLTAAIQTRNINNSQQEPPKVETAEDILTGALNKL